MNWRQRRIAQRGLTAGALAAGLLAAPQAHALDYQFDDVQVSLNTILSGGFIERTSPPKKSFIGLTNGGREPSSNFDNGTLNYRAGSLTFATFRVTPELSIKREDYGAFVRATGFFDAINDAVPTDFQQLNHAARRDIGADVRLLDAFVYGRPAIAEHPIDVRFGAQVLNWGESTFIQGGINSINPIDVTALHTPGSELRQALLPIPAIDLRTQVTNNVSVEGFYQFYWNRARFDPNGSFFSTNDSVSDGSRYNQVSQAAPDNFGSINSLSLAGGNVLGASLPRAVDQHPHNQGEFGLATRYSPEFLEGAEFGLFFTNYHSKFPFQSWRAGTRAGLLANEAALFSGRTNNVATYNSTASYQADYPNSIRQLGASYSLLGPYGFALQGEASYRFNQPIALAGASLAGLVQLPGLRGLAGDVPALAGALSGAINTLTADQTAQAAGGVPTYGSYLSGYKRYGVSQFQTTATKVYAGIPQAGISSITFVAEAGVTWVNGLSSTKGIYNANYATDSVATENNASPNPAYASSHGKVTSVSGGYVAALILEMPDTLPYGIIMRPAISLRHDVAGRSPGGAAFYNEGSAAVSSGVSFSYLNKWTAGVQFTHNFSLYNSGRFNGQIDRDFLSGVVAYTF